MKLTSVIELIGRGLSGATAFRTLGLGVGLPLSLGIAAVTEGPALWRWISHHGAAKQAKADAKLTAATAAIGADAAGQLAAHARDDDRITAATEEASHDVLQSNGAATPAPPGVARALHDALCLSDAYAAEPDCAALRGDRQGVGPAQPDAGGAAPR